MATEPSDTTLWLLLAAIPVMLLLSDLLSAAEAALTSPVRSKLKTLADRDRPVRREPRPQARTASK